MKKLFMYMMMAVTAIPLMAQNYLTLRYDRPADYWLEALPLGNGRLGAMVYGGVTSDTIQINEDTFWAGSPYNNINPNAKAHLQEIRDCINRHAGHCVGQVEGSRIVCRGCFRSLEVEHDVAERFIGHAVGGHIDVSGDV